MQNGSLIAFLNGGGVMFLIDLIHALFTEDYHIKEFFKTISGFLSVDSVSNPGEMNPLQRVTTLLLTITEFPQYSRPPKSSNH